MPADPVWRASADLVARLRMCTVPSFRRRCGLIVDVSMDDPPTCCRKVIFARRVSAPFETSRDAALPVPHHSGGADAICTVFVGGKACSRRDEASGAPDN